MTWRNVSDWAKGTPLTLRIADFLGRGRGGLRFIDRVHRPPAPPHKPSLAKWRRCELAAIWIGHATVLLRIGGMSVLTDPVFSNRIGLGLGLMTGGPRRFFAPALSLRELPRIDLIIVSHAHFDHLDRPTLNRLDKRTPVITSEHNSDLIADLGFAHISEMRWGESLRIGRVKLTARKVKHWGARTFYDQHRGFAGFLIESGKRRVLFAADTAYCDYFRDIGSIDLAIFGIGAYDPYVAAHATPEQAWKMASEIPAERLLPVHHSTFRLSHEAMAEPMHRLLAAAGDETHRVVVREIGGQWGI